MKMQQLFLKVSRRTGANYKGKRDAIMMIETEFVVAEPNQVVAAN